MNESRHILIVVGARPQFIKAAAIQRALEHSPKWTSTWVHTGQHHDDALSDVFFRELQLPNPDEWIHPNQTSREHRLGDMMYGIRKAIQRTQPGWVMVFGDTDSTLAGAWAATAESVPLIHIEAGLRSHQWSMPEEVNRMLTDRLSSVLVCPTDAAVMHLRNEGIYNEGREGKGSSATPYPYVLRTGDIMHDNAVHFSKSWSASERGKGKVLLTMHRPSNVDDPKRALDWLSSIGTWLRDNNLKALFPVHPRTEASLTNFSKEWREHCASMSIESIGPMGYLDVLKAIHHAPLVMTDSGGVQKESYSLGTRCVVLRAETEWIEQVECGQSILAPNPTDLSDCASEQFQLGPCSENGLYGDGQSACQILNCLEALASNDV